MPVLKLYLHGLTAGIPPTKNTHERARRGRVQGWSESSTRSNTRFLYSVEPDGLTGHGYALTLTLRDCPPASADFHRLRRAFIERLRRMGLMRMHWLIEWQRRGVPHLHAAVWFRRGNLRVHLVDQWCEVAKGYGAGWQAQHVEPIHDAVGWFRYLSKHASRGLSHYQRSPDGIPPGWSDGTGRMWGRLGVWQTRDAMDVSVDLSTYHRLRRIVRGWRRGDARRDQARARENLSPRGYWLAVRRLATARRMLKCGDPDLSAVRGLSEWMPLDHQLRVLAWLKSVGGELTST